MAQKISVEDYFEKNCIRQFSEKDMTQAQVDFYVDSDPNGDFVKKTFGDLLSSEGGAKFKKWYFENYFKTGFDDFNAGFIFETTKQIYRAVSQGLEGVESAYEPFCQSGLLGCFIASNIGSYKGVDLSAEGIKNAKERALKNSIDDSMFEQGDFYTFEPAKGTEALTGLNVLSDSFNHSLDMKCVKRVSELGIPNLVLIQNCMYKYSEREFTDPLKGIGYNSFEFLMKPEFVPKMGAYLMVLKAKK